jgi:hypothetical protein
MRLAAQSMDDSFPRIGLQRVAGTSLDHFYALVNLEIEEDVFEMRILAWNRQDWSCIYRDSVDFGTDLVVLQDGSVLIARDDAMLVILSGTSVELVDSRQTSGFGLKTLPDGRVLMAGPYLSVYDPITNSAKLLTTLRGHWAGICVRGDSIYLVGSKGRLAVLDLTKEKYPLTFIPLATEEQLTAVYEYPDQTLVIGGWHGLIHRRIDGKWEDISMDKYSQVMDLATRGDMLLACQGGVYSFHETSRTWEREIDEAEVVTAFSHIGERLLASHSSSGLLSVWDRDRWKTPYPTILSTPGLV